MLNSIKSLKRRLIGAEKDIKADFDVAFFCSNILDEVWIRSTFFECLKRGINVGLVVIGDKIIEDSSIPVRYKRASAKFYQTSSWRSASRVKCRIAVTASSGISKFFFPTNAKYLIHMPHSIVSLHAVYPADAFDDYDVIFAAGPHHINEFNWICKFRGLGVKKIIPVGYGKMDVLKDMALSRVVIEKTKRHILIAPSWGPDNLLDKLGFDLCIELLSRGYNVIVRPHPLFFIEGSKALDKITHLSKGFEFLEVESPFETDNAIFDADLLISDYSGIGFEFFILTGRPVISVDVGIKQANTEWKNCNEVPIEISARTNLGLIAKPDITSILNAIDKCLINNYKTNTEFANTIICNPDEACSSHATDNIQHLLSEFANVS